jgi:hypothetical protein
MTGAAIGGAAGVFAADSQTSPGTPVALVQVMSFDPFGDGVENVSRLDLLIDKKRSTTWFTKDPLTGENPKDGVGVYVALAESASLRSLTIDGTSQGWKADVYVADSPSAGLGGWGQAVEQVTNGSRHETVSLHGREGRYVLLWLTDFGPTSTQVTLSELSVHRA